MGPRSKGLNRSQENWVEYVKSRLSTSNRGDVIDFPGKKNATRRISSFTGTHLKSPKDQLTKHFWLIAKKTNRKDQTET